MTSLLEFYVDKQFLRTHEMAFKIPANSLKVFHLDVDVPLEFEDEFYYISKLAPIRIANELYYQVKANANWYRLGERKYLGLFQLTAVTPEVGLNAIMEAAQAAGYDWVYASVSSSTTFYSMEVEDASFLDLILQWAKITQCEVHFDTKARAVTMTEVIGANFGLSFQYRRNLKEIERVETPPAVTRFYPYGANDLSISSLNGGVEYLEDYSYYTNKGLTLPQAQAMYQKDFVIQDDTFVDVESLYNYAVNQIAIMAQPTVSYSAKVVDLSRITGYAESEFGLGDFVWVEDEPLGISVEARVVRYVRYPYEPHRNEVELAFSAIPLPGASTNTSRNTNRSWELFAATNENTERPISINRTVLHRMPLMANAEAEWIMSYSVRGTCEESGTLEISFWNDFDDTLVFPTITKTMTAGEYFHYSYSLGNETVPINTYQITIRAEMIGASGRFVIPADESQFWVFARGVTQGQNPQYTESIRFDYTKVAETWRVPDDVHELLIEAHGGMGSDNSSTTTPGGDPVGGCKIVFKMEVIAGDYYQIRVGGATPTGGGEGGPGGWPNGGLGDGASGDWTKGSGSTDMRLLGAADADCVVVAAGGGAGCEHVGDQSWGGYGGFEQGGDGWYQNSGGVSDKTQGGKGGTQSAGGAGAGGGSAGSFMQGGAGAWDGNAFHGVGGGGGGGWYGGGGGWNADGGGGGIGGYGGGGGSSHVADYVYDLEYQDGENNGPGYLIISWDDPTVP